MTGRREFGLDTLDFQQRYERIKEKGEHKRNKFIEKRY
jgi:hypothetical protein